MSPLYLPICGIYLPFQVNLYVPNSKPSNEIMFCMLEQLMYQLGMSVSSMLGGLFSRGVDSAPHSRERAGNWDAQSHDPKRSKKIKIIKQNSPGAVVCWRHSLFWASHGLMLVGGWGSINFYHSAWEPPIICSAWKISSSLVVMLTMKVCRSKYNLSLFQNRPLAPLQISASLCEGPIYLLLCWVITLLIKKHPLESTQSFAFITIDLYWVWLD